MFLTLPVLITIHSIAVGLTLAHTRQAKGVEAQEGQAAAEKAETMHRSLTSYFYPREVMGIKRRIRSTNPSVYSYQRMFWAAVLQVINQL